VFSSNDAMALGCLRALREANLRVPEDISIVGFDDIEVAKLLTPPLTTVRNSGTDLGRVAFARLLGMIRGEDQVLVPPIKWTIPTRIIERESVRKLE